MDQMEKHFLTAFLILAGASSIQAQETISGFQDYQFGMSIEEIMKISPITIQEETDPETPSYDVKDVRMLGEDFSVQLTFKDERLWNINVARMGYTVTNSFSCEADLDRAFAGMQANYGEPDTPLDKQDPMHMNACFTARDASQACVTSFHFDVLDSCSLIVAYKAPPEGGSF